MFSSQIWGYYIYRSSIFHIAEPIYSTFAYGVCDCLMVSHTSIIQPCFFTPSHLLPRDSTHLSATPKGNTDNLLPFYPLDASLLHQLPTMNSPKALEEGLKSQCILPLSKPVQPDDYTVPSASVFSRNSQRASNPNKQGGLYNKIHCNPQPGEPFFTGDIYQDRKNTAQSADEASNDAYYQHVLRLSDKWPRLRYLAEFMESSTNPRRASLLPPSDILRRHSIVNVGIIDFTDSSTIRNLEFKSYSELSGHLEATDLFNCHRRRLFVVEDLSKPVIEALGTAFDIDPRFFRAHLEDHTWYNIADDWVEMPELRSQYQNRTFMTFRYMEPRFFNNEEQARRAKQEVGSWNILRRLDFQGQVKCGINAWWEPSSRSVGLLRKKISIWTKSHGTGWTGVVLVDPPLQEGYPLWNGYGSLETPPSMSLSTSLHESHDTGRLSLFKVISHHMATQCTEDLKQLATDPESITKKIYPLIFGDMLVTLQYAFTSLFQIEWELDIERKRIPENLDRALDCLHKWKRRLPLLISYLVESITCFEGRYELGSNVYSESFMPHGPAQAVDSLNSKSKWQDEIWGDLFSILTKLDSLKSRANTIMNIAIAIISAEESKKAGIESRNVSRITYLAFFFVPMSFVSSFLSMSNDFSTRSPIVYLAFFSIAIPVTLIAFATAAYWNKMSTWWETRNSQSKLRND
ncbi:hypothetical protein BX600DRAFT_474821 [Xylariales sp. PMI_506]|nr:hypothetical protein BX600DRAFT_474821 [Xylariales sp. PMI_506]